MNTRQAYANKVYADTCMAQHEALQSDEEWKAILTSLSPAFTHVDNS